MQREDCFYFGKVIKTHGIKGEISIRVDADDPEAYRRLEYILMEVNNKLVPFFIESFKILGDKAYVALDGIDSHEQALTFSGKEIFLPLDLLPELNENQFYYHEVPGYLIIDEVAGLIGELTQVLEYPNQALFQLFKGDKEILIPIQDEIIKKVDKPNKTIYIRAPEGLIDLYLNS